jgi:hypothetical protein
VNLRPSHQDIDRANAAMDRRLAAIIRRHPRLLLLARADLRRWMARDGKCIRPAFQEWNFVLQRLDSREIAAFLLSETPMARRLRQSSPLVGIFGANKRRTIRRRREKART